MNMFSVFWDYRTYFATGIQYTLLLAAIGVICGFVLGIIISLMRMSRFWLPRLIGSVWVEILRGTPMVVQLFIIHYGLVAFGIKLTPIESGAITLSINSSAYLAEVFRAGIQGVDRGQSEAARSLGMTRSMTMRYIVLPQAVKSVLPAIGNEFITIIKESSIVSFIGVADLMYQSQAVQGITYDYLSPLLVIAAIYFIMTFTLSKLLGAFERRLNTDDQR
ncbi:polar amino acid transport system permease protein/polar amino acid transport system substrate-binding protein [Paenibacillus rhizosphaerae]|uniref:Polar amino acid transport system permease protein/polar amino acid transport system substrate-binding protein n=1 Tax=Paenibacillus rhizosphaerae TaxID=297318 RepID=A0A839TN39_9BACL|nr:polar amino acid transport system permease protein/polar amino acid transport system substrate-binding protein [Paenibacillus rhizosphaerae]